MIENCENINYDPTMKEELKNLHCNITELHKSDFYNGIQ